MKYLKYFENVEDLKVGDYVKLDLSAVREYNNENNLGFEEDVECDYGKITRIELGENFSHYVSLGDEGEFSIRKFRKEEILKKLTPEEFEMEKSVKKYNL